MLHTEKNKWILEGISWIKSLLFAAVIALLLRTFVFAPYLVEGASMEPTLHDNEKIFVNKFRSEKDLKRGDIIIIKGENENYVKRIIGFSGEKIEVVNDILFINGKAIKENYLIENKKIVKKSGSRLTGDFGPVFVPKNHLFVMGDNRLYSRDSRNGLGYIKMDTVIGKSEFVFFPFENIRDIK